MPTAAVATSTRVSDERLSRRAASPAAGAPSSSQTATSASEMPAILNAVSGSPSSATARPAVMTKLRRNTGALTLTRPDLRLWAKL